VSSFVYCAKGKKGAKTRSASARATVTVTTDVSPTVTTPTCKKPTRPLGGGFLTPYTDTGADRATTFITESQRVGRAWRTTGFVLGTVPNVQVSHTAIGVCS
jgi:hypothetical protein